MLLRPKSRGRISLRSANPYDKPVFEAGYFSDEHDEDIKTLVEGVKIALAMAQTRAFQRLGTKFWDQIPMPGCEETDLWSDEYWACMSRHYTTTIYHHSGAFKVTTCDTGYLQWSHPFMMQVLLKWVPPLIHNPLSTTNLKYELLLFVLKNVIVLNMNHGLTSHYAGLWNPEAPCDWRVHHAHYCFRHSFYFLNHIFDRFDIIVNSPLPLCNLLYFSPHLLSKETPMLPPSW